MTGTADRVVDVRGLRMRYGAKDVLTGVDMHVRRGEIVALLGPNGAGKTTTIEILEGFRARSDGEVQVLGHDPATAPQSWRAGIGIVLQSWRDHGRWNVRALLDHLGELYEPYSTPSRRRPRETDELLDAVGLTDLAHRRISKLSGGERRRLDEPTAGFDPEARRDFHDIVHGLVDLDDTSILLTTHDLAEAEKLADRILILSGGRIVADGSPAQLAREAAGSSEVRWSRGGETFVHADHDATSFVRGLFAQYGEEITDLEVTRSSLEETYMALVHRHEAAEDAVGDREPTEGVAR
jgi:ABC-2 type transport system ATP-binding protein